MRSPRSPPPRTPPIDEDAISPIKQENKGCQAWLYIQLNGSLHLKHKSKSELGVKDVSLYFAMTQNIKDFLLGKEKYGVDAITC